MDANKMEELVRKLVQSPHDQNTLLQAHAEGQHDPEGYATVLERVGGATADPALSAHWLSEAANVWIMTLNDEHRAARVLMVAVDRDPSSDRPANMLAELYQKRGDLKAQVALLDRRAKTLETQIKIRPELRAIVVALRVQLGELWLDRRIQNGEKSAEQYELAIALDAQQIVAVYHKREELRAQGENVLACHLYLPELNHTADQARKEALFADWSELADSTHNAQLKIAVAEARLARNLSDATLRQQLASLIFETHRAKIKVSSEQLHRAAELFVSLAEQYPGEHALAYSLCGAECEPSHDRAVQLAVFYGEQLGRQAEVEACAKQYLSVSPHGAISADALRLVQSVGGAAPLPPPPAPAAPAYVSKLEAPSFEASDLEETRKAPEVEAIEELEELEEEVTPEPVVQVKSDEDKLLALLEEASVFAKKQRRTEALECYLKALELDPGSEEALEYADAHYRRLRKFDLLRELYQNAAKHVKAADYYLKVAELSESQLQDPAGSIEALRALYALEGDAEIRQRLLKLLESTGAWVALLSEWFDDYEAESNEQAALEIIEKIVKLQIEKLQDSAAAAQTWLNYIDRVPGNFTAIQEAAKLLRKGGSTRSAVELLDRSVASISDDAQAISLGTEAGQAWEQLDEAMLAAESYASVANRPGGFALWIEAQRCFMEAEAWNQAANVCEERLIQIDDEEEKKALLLDRARLLIHGEQADLARECYELCIELSPEDEIVADELQKLLILQSDFNSVAALQLRRAEKHSDASMRIKLRKDAARIYRENLNSNDEARACFEEALSDGEDVECLSWLATDAESNQEYVRAAEFLERQIAQLEGIDSGRGECLLRLARIQLGGLQDSVVAGETLLRILNEVDSEHEFALKELAKIHESESEFEIAAGYVARLVPLAQAGEERAAVARHWAELLGSSSDLEGRNQAWLLVAENDPDDFEALEQLHLLAKELGNWEKVFELSGRLAEMEGDETNLLLIAEDRARIAHEHLGKSDAALELLLPYAEAGQESSRQLLLEIAIESGQALRSAQLCLAWYGEASAADESRTYLYTAFETAKSVNEPSLLCGLGIALGRHQSLPLEFADSLEETAIEQKNFDALAVAFEARIQELEGESCSREWLRQIAIRQELGGELGDSVAEAELSLVPLPYDTVLELLSEFAGLFDTEDEKIDLYARQVERANSAEERTASLIHAAQVAGSFGKWTRAEAFFESAVDAGHSESDIEHLVEKCQASDREAKGTDYLRAFLRALSRAGEKSGDGGRHDAQLKLEAAKIAFRELKDSELGLSLIRASLSINATDDCIDLLFEFASQAGLGEESIQLIDAVSADVHDGPHTRLLLRARARFNLELLKDRTGAKADFKRLYDLSPADLDVSQALINLYESDRDYTDLVHLYEDQVLRLRDPEERVELARKVARIWEGKIGDPRESADAWRRVLRMAKSDEEASEGLARAKQGMLSVSRDEVLSERISDEIIAASNVVSAEVTSEATLAADELSDEEGPEATTDAAEAASIEAAGAAAELVEADSLEANSTIAENVETAHSPDAAFEDSKTEVMASLSDVLSEESLAEESSLSLGDSATNETPIYADSSEELTSVAKYPYDDSDEDEKLTAESHLEDQTAVIVVPETATSEETIEEARKSLPTLETEEDEELLLIEEETEEILEDGEEASEELQASAAMPAAPVSSLPPPPPGSARRAPPPPSGGRSMPPPPPPGGRSMPPPPPGGRSMPPPPPRAKREETADASDTSELSDFFKD